MYIEMKTTLAISTRMDCANAFERERELVYEIPFRNGNIAANDMAI